MLSQTARWISEICVPSSLFSSRFYVCSESDFEDLFTAGGALGPMSASNRSAAAETAKELLGVSASQCPEVSDSLIEFARLLMIWLMDLRVQGYEPFVPFEGLEQLHRFLFILGITHVAYSFVTVVLSMIKVTWLSSLCIWSLVFCTLRFLRSFLHNVCPLILLPRLVVTSKYVRITPAFDWSIGK
ncbi:hypothetical protein BHM03_00014963 [Ensete ventricosum]|nr:hypothetical protein BHM03_00014963 [Ensete ventricosum]